MFSSSLQLITLSLILATSLSQSFRFFPRTYQSIETLKAMSSSQTDPDSTLMDDYSRTVNKLWKFGEWRSSSQLLNFFDSDSGLLSFKGQSSTGMQAYTQWNFAVSIYDGEYTNEKYARFSMTVDNPKEAFEANYTNATFKISNAFLLSQGRYHHTDISYQCQSNLTFYFIDTAQGKPLTEFSDDYMDNLGFQFSIASDDCSLFLTTPVLQRGFPVDAVMVAVYVVLVLVSNILNLVSIKKIMAKSEKRRSTYEMLSNWSLLPLNAWDTYLILFHLVATKEFTGWFVGPAIIMLFLLTAPDNLIMFLVFNSNENAQRYTPKMRCFLVGLYYVCFGTLLLFLLLSPTIWKQLIPAIFLFPQIILTLFTGKHYVFTRWYEFGMTFSRFIWILYLNAYKDNIFKNSPNFLLVAIFSSLIALQIAILLIQTKYPRFFWTKKPFRYTCMPNSLEDKTDICPICIEPLLKEDLALSQKLLEEEENRRRVSTKVYRTPCRHNFHNKCLKKWMQQKFECPFCKQRLPSINVEVGRQSL